MIIKQPFIEQDGEWTSVASLITNEVTKEEKKYFFRVKNEYASYLVNEHADAFVLAVLCTATETGQDIIVEGTVSDQFSYHFKALSYITAKAAKCREAILKAQKVEHFDFQPSAVGTAFSGGVDSLATFINHRKGNPDCPESFQITHLTLFSSFAYGTEYAKSYPLFMEDAMSLQTFADQENLPLVLIDSNTCELIEFAEHISGFTSCFIHYICASVLVLQKLFKTYLISSGYTADKFHLSVNQSYSDLLISRLLSDHNTTVTVAETTLNRVEKTKAIADYPLAKKCLSVCWHNQCADTYNWTIELDGYINCGQCGKCQRTLTTLDLLGAVEHFSQVFDLKKYAEQREEFLFKMFTARDINVSCGEICELMKVKAPELIQRFTIKEDQINKAKAKQPFTKRAIKRIKRMTPSLLKKLIKKVRRK